VLVIMDRQNRRHEARETKGVLLPAWSYDGKQIAWLEQQGRTHFTLKVARIS
jgi:hypothetical protein